ncbi:hypothetical protein [Catenuloplanes japonicus]|uniref:hypothetical protein n=1 Tax=Catenuloplanes japonicus TaxID=33876 RepID=UPI00068F0C10|nr:hypothetical protein [Catenuloplanes japonicus]
MSNIQLIVAALAAGASVGVTNTAATVVQDAYAGLKSLLRPWVRGDARAALEADETEAEAWQDRLGEELQASGAAEDEHILEAARQLLAAADPARASTFHIEVGTNHGAIGGEFSGPVTFHQGPPNHPPQPATE